MGKYFGSHYGAFSNMSTCPISLSLVTSTSCFFIGNCLLGILTPEKISCLVPHNLFKCHFIIIHQDLRIVVGCKQCFSIFLTLTSIFNMSHTKAISTSYSTKLHIMWMTTFGTFRFKCLMHKHIVAI